MTRCECSGLTFRAVAELADREGIVGVDGVCRRAGCGMLCTACRPDLEAYLHGHAAARKGAACPSPVAR